MGEDRFTLSFHRYLDNDFARNCFHFYLLVF